MVQGKFAPNFVPMSSGLLPSAVLLTICQAVLKECWALKEVHVWGIFMQPEAHSLGFALSGKHA